MTSWKTTLPGIAGVIVVIASAIKVQFDGDPATVPGWTAVGGLLTVAIGRLVALDNDTTSERAGAVR